MEFEDGNGLRAARLAGPPRFRTHRPAAAGRRRARLPIRAASIRRWPRPISIRTGSPASRSAPSTAALIAGNPPERRVERLRAVLGDRQPSRRSASPHLAASTSTNDMLHQCINQFRAMGTLLWGAPELLQAAHAAADLHAGQQSRRPQLLRYRAAQGAARAAGRFRPDQRARCASASARPTSRPATSSTSTPPTHKIGPEHIMASGSLPPGFPGHRDRRRALLGRRRRLQHAAAMGARRRAAPGHARLPDRPVERARRAAARHDRGRRRARRTSAIRAAPALAPTSSARRRRCAAPPPSCWRRSRGAAPDARGELLAARPTTRSTTSSR